MKKIFLLMLIVNISCNAQKKTFMIPEVDNKFEKFDSIKFNSATKESSDILREFLSNGNYIEMTVSNSGKYYLETFKDSYYMISKSFYSNGNIKRKGLGFNGDAFQKGIWYEFDENGNLIKEINYDKPFKFTFEEILKFCKKQGIKIDKGPILQSTGWHNKIFREIEEEHPIWKIEYLKKSNLVEIIKLDGVTGKVLGTSTYKYINN